MFDNSLPKEHPPSTSPIWQCARQHQASEIVPDFDQVALRTMISNLRNVQLQALQLGERAGGGPVAGVSRAWQ